MDRATRAILLENARRFQAGDLPSTSSSPVLCMQPIPVSVAIRAYWRNIMSNKPEEKPKPGLLCEDETVVGGTDKETGAPVIRPKTPEGTADSLTEATDARENAPAAESSPEPASEPEA